MDDWELDDEYEETDWDQDSIDRGDELSTQRRPSLNKRANEAADAVGLNNEQRQRFHRHLSELGNDNLEYHELVRIAQDFLH